MNKAMWAEMKCYLPLNINNHVNGSSNAKSFELEAKSIILGKSPRLFALKGISEMPSEILELSLDRYLDRTSLPNIT